MSYFFFVVIYILSHEYIEIMISIYDVIIIWAGPAGLWLWKKLQELGINYVILEKDTIWSSFLNWNNKTKFITPSFPGNAFWNVDLNSIDYSSSPGLFQWKEHLNWLEYSAYLKDFYTKHKLNIHIDQEVLEIKKINDIFTIFTKKHKYFSKYICCAMWEFNAPNFWNIIGSDLSIHSSEIKNYDYFKYIYWKIPIIGWYESAIDLAYNLVKLWKEVSIFSRNEIDNFQSSDPSKVLSLISMEKLRTIQQSPLFSFTKDTLTSLSYVDENYILSSQNNTYNFWNKPIFATGFRSSFKPLWNLVSYRNDGYPEVNNFDELKHTKWIFMSGPIIRHEELIFCFIYKFRQRFWIIALEIAKRLWTNLEYELIKKKWKKEWFYLDNLSHCWDECIC